jgi:L-iditol 2-dehydrogenase
MKAAVLENVEKINIKDIEKPVPNGKNVLIKVKVCGICGTDVHAYYGDWSSTFPLVLGHEFSGIIEEIGPEVKYVKPGERVTVAPDIYCHNCDKCRTGNEKLCRNVECIGSEWNGAFTEYCLVPEQIIYTLPEKVSFDAATFVEPMACAFTVVKNIPEVYSKRILITGAGSLGLIFTMLLKNLSPLKLDITSRSDEKIEIAKKLGAEEGFNTSDTSGSYTKLTNNKYDIVIDVTGISEVVENSFNLLDSNGSLYIFGVAKPDDVLKLNHFSIFNKNIKISGGFPDLRSFEYIIKMLDKKILDPSPIISHRFSLDNFMEGFNLTKKQSGSVMKVLIYP